MRNDWGKSEWLIAYCAIQPSVAEGTAAFNTAWSGAIGSPLRNFYVLSSYYEYLARGQPILTQAEFDTCLYNAQAINFDFDFILEHASSYKDKRLV